VKLLVSTGKPTTVTYQGSGAIVALDPESDELDVAFSDGNAPLDALLAAAADEADGGDDTGVALPVSVDAHTTVTVTRTDGEDSGDDLGFACAGDDVSVTVVAPGPLDGLDDVPAQTVTIASSEDSDCGADAGADDGR
jgi:hypothetical protein